MLVDLIGADLEQVVRHHLAGLGYLRATVTATVDQTVADQLTASVQVDPGRGHDRAPSGVLGQHRDEREGAAGAGRARPLWTPRHGRPPRRCSRPLESAYAARGYLAAHATAAAIAFAGNAATLPIRLVEGPLARIATFTVTGAAPGREQEAIAATGLSVGSTYVAGGEQSLRLAIERHYRNLGYRDASVEAETTVHAGRGPGGHRRQRAARGRSTSCSRCAPAASRARATRWSSGRRGFKPGPRPARR